MSSETNQTTAITSERCDLHYRLVPTLARLQQRHRSLAERGIVADAQLVGETCERIGRLLERLYDWTATDADEVRALLDGHHAP